MRVLEKISDIQLSKNILQLIFDSNLQLTRIPRQLLGETAGNVEISQFADVGQLRNFNVGEISLLKAIKETAHLQLDGIR